jgi:serine/threonine protein phosphatase PrpC
MIPSERAHLQISAVTDAGISGKDNEDRYAVSAFRTDTNPPIHSIFAVVADGIGGHLAGEVASEMAVNLISQFIAASDGAQPTYLLAEAIIQASKKIYRAAESNREHQGMGSTCACAWVVGERLYMATVGDSRIYLIHKNTIKQLNKDHTWVQEAMDSGALSPDEAREHPNAHVIRRYLGSRQTVMPDFRILLKGNETDAQAERNQGMALLPGDCLLLCSDGLTDLVSDEEIQSRIQNKKGKNVVNDLVALANQRGGHDNITIITLTVPEETRRVIVEPAPKPKTRSRWSCVIIGALLLAIIAIVGGLTWYFNNGGVNIDPTATLSFETNITQAPLATGEASQPGVAIPNATPSGEVLASPTPTITTQPVFSPPLFTLTPWPTNTQAP